MSKHRLLLIVLTVFALVAIGCTPTGDDDRDPESAATIMDGVQDALDANYTSTNADSVREALATVGTAGSVVTGNPALALAINRVDTLIVCFQDVGAVAVRIFYSNNLQQVPQFGVLAIINENRVTDNLIPCLTRPPLVGAQSAGDVVEPCSGDGAFTVAGDTIRYFYVASDPTLCSNFVNALNAQAG